MADTTKDIVYKIHVEGDGMATIRDMKGQIVATQVPLKNLRQEFGNFSKTIDGTKFNKFNAGLKETRKSMDGFKASTGSSTSAALELSRVIQDAPFGMRGMANNLSQLSASLAFASKQAGGFSMALKGMFAALKGPLGILVAIEAVMAAFQIFSARAKDATEDVEDLSAATNDLVGKFELLKRNVVTGGFIQELLGTEKAGVGLKILNNEFDDFAKKYESLTEDEKNNEDVVNNLIDKYGELLTVRSQIAKTQEELAENEIEDTGISNKQLETRLWNLFRVKMELEEIFEVEKKTAKQRQKQIKIFRKQFLDLQKEIDGFNKEWLLGTERTALGRLEIEQEFEKKDLDLKRDAFIEKQEQRLAHEKEMLKLNKITNDEFLRAEAKVRESILEAEEEHQRAITAIRKKHAQERFDLFLKDLQRSVDEYIKASNREEATLLNLDVQLDSGVDRIEREIEMNARLFDHKIAQIDREIEARKAAGEDYAGLEKQRTALEAEESARRVLLEQEAQEAKVAIVGMAFQAIAQIAAEGSAIQKAASVASTIISTYEAATAALGAKPYGPWNIAQAAVVTAMGLANVNKILQTKTPGESSVGGGGGTAPSGPTFSPSFNVVGNNQQSQLANTIAEQTAQPVQAFVVYDDIETAAQLEQSAVNSAGF